ncbi:DUF418 domain-containing protein [Georgenia sp. Z1491]|uniref:DUF418 domain-containing protein n=1 Tax=Georgenia sp. Z1491 TaxID=3416707 RepID=UPI003CF1A724
MSQPIGPAERGPTPLAERALAPDLARGAMLLLIALANVRAFVDVPREGLRGYPDPATTTVLDDVVAAFQLVLVDGRAYPLFGLLFGYGVWQLASRRLDDGASAATVVGILRRRSVVLVGIGAAHGILFFPGEILAAYGLLLLLLPGAMVRAHDAALLAWAGIAGVLVVLLLAGSGSFGAVADPIPAELGPAVREHLVDWPTGGVLSNAIGVSVTVPLGVLAARHRVLEQPAGHRALLVRCAAFGLGAAVVLGAWYALVAAGAVGPPSEGAAPLMGLLHGAGGYAGGIGYAALLGLVATRVAHNPEGGPAAPGPATQGLVTPGRTAARRPRGGALTTAISSLGRMSMSGYLLQTLVFVVVLVPWGPLALGRDITNLQAAGVAMGAWVLGLAVAAVLARGDRRGPFEALVRWWTYRGTAAGTRGPT